jgi:glycosyltransferase involved in cell wall biosynthesis
LRLCHVNLSKELRGGETQLLVLVETLAGRYRQSVVVRRQARLHAKLEREGMPGLEVIPVANSVLAAVRAARGMDLIHVHEGRSVQVGAARSLLGSPFIVTRRVLNRPRSNAATRWCYARAAAIVGVSEAVSRVMRDYLGRDDVETIIDCTSRISVDADHARALRARYPGKLVIGHVGELDDRHKGQSIILEAARRAKSAAPNLVFLLVGSGRDEAALRAAARDLDNVEFTGRVDSVGDYYAAMDVFVFPSREEALGSAILEAMSCGVPAVASAVGGIPEVVKPNENGLLFDSGNAEQLFDRIVARARDDALRARFAEGARATARARSAEIVADAYASVYERVLAG